MFRPTFVFLALVLAQIVIAHPGPHVSHRRFAHDWAQPQNHSVNALFKRGKGNDGATYPEVGSDEWRSRFPPAGSTPDKSRTPKEWLDALAAAVAAGKIPNIPQTKAVGDPEHPANPEYPAGTVGTSPEVCSSTLQCKDDTVVYDGPEGMYGTSFDDGPMAGTPILVDFLKKNNEIATHFMIGGNMLNNFNQFKDILSYGGDCAVHTWSHPYMTSLSNEDILAELGWTMQIIHDSTGGKVPKLWRPPTGDSDTRVRAVAKEVFGMTTVIWNQDSDDWGIVGGQQTIEGIGKAVEQWVAGPKSNGLIPLHHEQTENTVKGYTESYSKIKPAGWKTSSLARLVGGNDQGYQNVQGDEVTPANVYRDGGAKGSDNPNTNTNTSKSNTPAPGQNTQTQNTQTSGKPTSTGSSSGSAANPTNSSANQGSNGAASISFSWWITAALSLPYVLVVVS